jgi:hypothetical protein
MMKHFLTRDPHTSWIRIISNFKFPRRKTADSQPAGAEVAFGATSRRSQLTGQFTNSWQLVAAVILLIAFVLAARRTKTDRGPRGRIANLLETFVIFIRDEIAKPAIGSKDAYRFLPFLLTLFFFILTLNLIGMLPWQLARIHFGHHRVRLVHVCDRLDRVLRRWLIHFRCPSPAHGFRSRWRFGW